VLKKRVLRGIYVGLSGRRFQKTEQKTFYRPAGFLKASKLRWARLTA
jgi:hypothetical protein